MANRFYIAEVAQRKAANANLDTGTRLLIPELAQPYGEEVCLADLNYV